MTNPDAKTLIARRTLIRATGGVLLGAGLAGGTTALAQAKVSQKSVAYQDTPKGDQECDNCRLFVPPTECKSVQGPVAAKGWCKIWGKKT